MTTSSPFPQTTTPVEDVAWLLRTELQDQFSVSQMTYPVDRTQPIRFTGRLLAEASSAYRVLRQRFTRYGYTPLLRRAGSEDLVFAMPGVIKTTPSRAWINVVLFILTVVTTLFIGAGNVLGRFPSTFGELWAGASFALPLLAILTTHEFGHYFMARWHKVDVTLPYFIPVPFGLGTFGAFIKMKTPVEDRRALFDVALAGPLAGLAVAIPLLVVGLLLSEVGPVVRGGVQEGNSILYLTLKFLVLGKILPSGGMDVYLHPMAFAAWFGLLVTMFNLLPVGQLDGGHIIYALLGNASRWIGYGVLGLLVVLGLMAWQGWFVWAALIFFVTGLRHPAPLNEVTKLDPIRVGLGLFALILFVLTFTPVPLSGI